MRFAGGDHKAMEKRNDDKKNRLLKALEEGITQIHLDARRPGVLVPHRFGGDHHLVLNLSYRFDPPDLTVNDWGVRETLSFNGERFTVGVPWSAVYAIASHVSHDFVMFPEDMPEELLQGSVERQQAVPPLEAKAADMPVAEPLVAKAERPETSHGGLREVVLEGTDELPKQPSPPKRGHLRVVK